MHHKQGERFRITKRMSEEIQPGQTGLLRLLVVAPKKPGTKVAIYSISVSRNNVPNKRIELIINVSESAAAGGGGPFSQPKEQEMVSQSSISMQEQELLSLIRNKRLDTSKLINDIRYFGLD